MSPVKLKIIAVTTLQPPFKAFFVLLTENLLLLVEFLYGKSFQMLKILTNKEGASLEFLQLEH